MLDMWATQTARRVARCSRSRAHGITHAKTCRSVAPTISTRPVFGVQVLLPTICAERRLGRAHWDGARRDDCAESSFASGGVSPLL